jgi:2-phospho-L-lactate guanylyltransferase
MSAPPHDAHGPAADRLSFAVVVPLKPVRVAKSRLSPLGEAARRELVEALAVDTLSAAAACPLVSLVLVVSDDVTLASTVRALGVPAIPDGATGLNATLRQGAAELARRAPGSRPVAICGDLPCLRADDLAESLQHAPRRLASFVSDAAGQGTTLYTAPGLELFAPRFGSGSRAAHLSDGAVELTSASPPSVRRDVDTPADLREALSLGVGERTARAVARLPGLSASGG